MKARRVVDAIVGVDPSLTDWRFSEAALAEQVARRWHGTNVREVADLKRKSSHEWSIKLPESIGKTLDGYLSRTGVRIGLKGTVEDCARFVLWLRAIVPLDVELSMWDDQHPDPLAIRFDTTKESILDTFE